MTLVVNSSNSSTVKIQNSDNESDSFSDNSDDDEQFPIKNSAIIQNLGYPNVDLVPNFGNVSVENSTDVHFGDKNFYNGPVNIKQIVYANNNNEGRDSNNLRVASKEEEEEQEAKTERCNVTEEEKNPKKKGFICLQKLSKYRSMEISIFLIVLILFIVILMLLVFLRPLQFSPGNSKLNNNNDEPNYIKPVDYNPDLTVNGQSTKYRFVTRYQWVAQPPINETTPLNTPVPFVIIHHTATENCSSQAQCVLHVRVIQTFHIESKGWYDIGYNFLIGGDGAVYEGRGWTVVGAHTFGWNSRSIGIALIGTFVQDSPTNVQILTCKKLIAEGVKLGFIQDSYSIFGARQFSGTESPGKNLYNIIKTWPHWKKEPPPNEL